MAITNRNSMRMRKANGEFVAGGIFESVAEFVKHWFWDAVELKGAGLSRGL